MYKYIFSIFSLFLFSCSLFDSQSEKTQENQFIKIFLKIGKADVIDTFNNRLVKDLVPDTIAIPFYLTKREQEIIQIRATYNILLQIPDTINPIGKKWEALENYYPIILRIQTKEIDKTIIAYEPFDITENRFYGHFQKILDLILAIVYSKEEYKKLPERKAGYL